MKLLEQAIEGVIQFGLDKVLTREDHAAILLSYLIQIQYCYYHYEYLPEDLHYPDPPMYNPQDILKNIKTNFPKLGKYISVDVSNSKVKNNIYEDLTTIIIELLDIQWYLLKTSKRFTLQSFKHSYEKKLELLLARVVLFFVQKKK